MADSKQRTRLEQKKTDTKASEVFAPDSARGIILELTTISARQTATANAIQQQFKMAEDAKGDAKEVFDDDGHKIDVWRALSAAEDAIAWFEALGASDTAEELGATVARFKRNSELYQREQAYCARLATIFNSATMKAWRDDTANIDDRLRRLEHSLRVDGRSSPPDSQ